MTPYSSSHNPCIQYKMDIYKVSSIMLSLHLHPYSKLPITPLWLYMHNTHNFSHFKYHNHISLYIKCTRSPLLFTQILTLLLHSANVLMPQKKRRPATTNARVSQTGKAIEQPSERSRRAMKRAQLAEETEVVRTNKVRRKSLISSKSFPDANYRTGSRSRDR